MMVNGGNLRDLAEWKCSWALFRQISADTKDLKDIPRYGPQMQARDLPAVQYTAREVRSGLQFLAYASRRSAPASELFAQRIQRYPQSCGVKLGDVTWQTDNGGEFIGQLQPDGSIPGVLWLIIPGTSADLIAGGVLVLDRFSAPLERSARTQWLTT